MKLVNSVIILDNYKHCVLLTYNKYLTYLKYLIFNKESRLNKADVF